MRKSLYIPIMLALGLLSIWFLVPSELACAAFDVSSANCSSWTSGLFGVGLGGVLTLWASWYFGEKSSEDIALHINKAVDLKLQEASEKLVSHMEEQLKQAAETMIKNIPDETIDAMKGDAATTLLFASAPLLIKVLPALAKLSSTVKSPTNSAQDSDPESTTPG